MTASDRSAPDAAGPGSEHRRPLDAVLTATFFVRFAFGLTLAVFASYLRGHATGFGAEDVGVVGLISAMAPVGEFSTVLLSGALADRYGRWPVLFGGMGGAAVLFLVSASTRDPLLLGGANLCFGVASGAILAASLAVVGDRASTERRGFEMGRFDAVNLFGWVLGFATGFLLQGSLPNARLDEVFLLGSGALALGLTATALLVRGFPTYHGTPAYSLGPVLSNVFRRSVLLVTLPWLVVYALIGTALIFLGDAAGGIGISSSLLAAVIGGGGLLFVLTQPFYGGLADRFGRNRLLTLGAGGFVAAMACAILILTFGPLLPLLAVLAVSALVALSYGPAALAALADLSRQVSRATTMAIYSLTISLGMVIGLAASTTLYAREGNLGLDAFFGSIALALVVLTGLRLRDVPTPVPPGPTTPARSQRGG